MYVFLAFWLTSSCKVLVRDGLDRHVGVPGDPGGGDNSSSSSSDDSDIRSVIVISRAVGIRSNESSLESILTWAESKFLSF